MPVNTISGRVVVKGTVLGIPNLLVVLHDLDPGTAPEEAQPMSGAGPIGTIAPPPTPTGLGDRLGSRLTDAAGGFVFTLEDEEFRIRNEKEQRRPPPEGDGAGGTRRRPGVARALHEPRDPPRRRPHRAVPDLPDGGGAAARACRCRSIPRWRAKTFEPSRASSRRPPPRRGA